MLIQITRDMWRFLLSYMIFNVPPYQPMGAQQSNSNIQLRLVGEKKDIDIVCLFQVLVVYLL